MESEKIVVPISVNTEELDKGIEKAEQLVELLKKANSLVDELTGRNFIDPDELVETTAKNKSRF
ncbi:hypothetical protein AAHB45_02320 [Pediococcus pentosaceus]|uniref:hypothetical protein n=1 Tax=Pediococcus pentosaceus TaxID=1255 RepID=UPI00316522B7